MIIKNKQSIFNTYLASYSFEQRNISEFCCSVFVLETEVSPIKTVRFVLYLTKGYTKQTFEYFYNFVTLHFVPLTMPETD